MEVALSINSAIKKMNKQKIILFLSWFLLVLSLYIGISDIFELSYCKNLCESVHTSSFGSFLGVPLAFYGAGIIFLFIVFSYIFPQKKIASILLIFLTGCELYFTILQFTFLNSLCFYCIAFASGLFILFFLDKVSYVKTLGVFFITGAVHFIFFPPININYNKSFFSVVKESDLPQVTVYASPSCKYCEKAVDFFNNFCCTNKNIKVYVKPVSVSAKDKEKAILKLCKELFSSEGNSLEKRVAENFIINNEKELKDKIGNIKTPYIEIKSNIGIKGFVGWNEKEFLQYLSFLSNENLLIDKSDHFDFNSSFNKERMNVCTSDAEECLL